MPNMYVLDGHEPKRERDLIRWATWFEHADRIVARTVQDDVSVSTVFLGLDHGFGGKRLLFETMVFGNYSEGDGERYATWDEAVEGHKRWVKRVFAPRQIVL